MELELGLFLGLEDFPLAFELGFEIGGVDALLKCDPLLLDLLYELLLGVELLDHLFVDFVNAHLRLKLVFDFYQKKAAFLTVGQDFALHEVDIFAAHFSVVFQIES